MSLTKDDVAALLNAALTTALAPVTTQISMLGNQVSDLGGRMTKLENDLGGRMGKLEERFSTLDGQVQAINRTVNAIESFPVPYGRPKTYVSATQFQSVTQPVRVKQGHTG